MAVDDYIRRDWVSETGAAQRELVARINALRDLDAFVRHTIQVHASLAPSAVIVPLAWEFEEGTTALGIRCISADVPVPMMAYAR